MKKLLSALVALSVMSTLSACSTWNKLDNQERGAIIGGGTGAVVGHSVSPGATGTILGGAAGAVGGGLIGREMDRDRRYSRRY